MQEINSNSARTHWPLSTEMSATLQFAREAAASLQPRVGRFELYDYLEGIYSIYFEWKRRKCARRLALGLAEELDIAQRKGMSPIRVLIEATLPNAHFKQKSRWVRALEFVYSASVSPSRFRRFVGTRGGVAGCASFAVKASRKRRRPGGDWDD